MEEAEHGKCGEELFHRHTELFIPYQHLFAWISGSRSAFWIIPARFRRWLRVHRGKRVTIHSRQPPTRPRMLGPSLQKAEAPVRQPPFLPRRLVLVVGRALYLSGSRVLVLDWAVFL